MIVRVEAVDGLHPESIIGSLAAHTVPGLERTDIGAGTHSRLLSLPNGLCDVTIRPEAHGVEISTTSTEADLAQLVRVVSEWLDLATDLAPIRDHLASDRLLAPLLQARPGLRVIGTTSPFQSAVTTVLGQQVSLAAGRTFAGRLVARYGSDGPLGLRKFPDPSTLAGADAEELRAVVGLTSARAKTVSALARAWSASNGSPSREELLAVPGIGRWTVDYLSVRFGDRDAFTPGDLVLRKALGGVTALEAERRSEAWRPYRAYALMHLWTETAY